MRRSHESLSSQLLIFSQPFQTFIRKLKNSEMHWKHLGSLSTLHWSFTHNTPNTLIITSKHLLVMPTQLVMLIATLIVLKVLKRRLASLAKLA